MRVPCIDVPEISRCGAAAGGAMCLSKLLAVQRAAGIRFAVVDAPRRWEIYTASAVVSSLLRAGNRYHDSRHPREVSIPRNVWRPGLWPVLISVAIAHTPSREKIVNGLARRACRDCSRTRIAGNGCLQRLGCCPLLQQTRLIDRRCLKHICAAWRETLGSRDRRTGNDYVVLYGEADN